MIRARLLASALADIRKEKAFYRRINPELSVRFQHSVETAVSAAAENPLAMQTLKHEVRRWPLKGFPHGVLYRVEADTILVLAVFHPSQKPGKWASRFVG